MSVPDYNDGKWHGWNGGECPVHPKTEVDVVLRCGALKAGNLGQDLYWSGPDKLPRSHIVAFRVVKVYREPREFWIGNDPNRKNVDGTGNSNPIFSSREHALRMGWGNQQDDLIHVREVPQ